MAVVPKRSTRGYAARLITQGSHRFFTLTLPSDALADTCVVDTREENPINGFQRVLDEKRAQDIADYIDNGFGTIPCSIVLSAQPKAQHRWYQAERQTFKLVNKYAGFWWWAAPRVGCASLVCVYVT